MTGKIQRQKIAWRDFGSGTYISNSFITAEDFRRTHFFANGNTTYMYINYQLSGASTSSTQFVTIGYTPYDVGSWGFLFCAPLQGTTATATLMVQGTTIQLFKNNTSSGWLRGTQVCCHT